MNTSDLIRQTELRIKPNIMLDYINYFKIESDANSSAPATARQPPADIAWAMLKRSRHAIYGVLTNICIILTTLSAPLAAQIGPSGSHAPAQDPAPAIKSAGLDALKAQMNAMRSGLDNLRRLRGFLDAPGSSGEAIVARAQHLIETLPVHDDASTAAWRIAAVASLALKAGRLNDIDVDNEYRLPSGAVGWDLGPEGAPVHAGFTPVTPATLAAPTNHSPRETRRPGRANRSRTSCSTARGKRDGVDDFGFQISDLRFFSASHARALVIGV